MKKQTWTVYLRHERSTWDMNGLPQTLTVYLRHEQSTSDTVLVPFECILYVFSKLALSQNGSTEFSFEHIYWIELISHSRTTMHRHNDKNNEIHNKIYINQDWHVYSYVRKQCSLSTVLPLLPDGHFTYLLFFHKGNGMQFTINNNNNDKNK